MQNYQIIQLKLNPCGGRSDISSVSAVAGDRIGQLPTPSRRGYTFSGWYTGPESDTNAVQVTATTPVDDRLTGGDLTLYAHWTASARESVKSSTRRITRSVIIAAVCVAVLIAGLVFTLKIIEIYRYQDVDGTVYQIRKDSDGVYGLYTKDKTPCDINDDKLWLTAVGTQLSINPESGEYEIYAVVDTQDTEKLGFNRRVLMFKQLTYDRSSTTDDTRVIQSIEVHNAYGDMTFYRSNPNSNYFSILGYESTLFSTELFAQLSSGCGYTISSDRLKNPVRLADGTIDYAEYGLVPETRTVTDEDGNTSEVDYVPASYTVTTMLPDKDTGLSSYTVTIGDATVSGAGYYARYGDRDTVYILSSYNIEAAVLVPIETLVTPMVIYPMSLNSYFDVEDFTLMANTDYEGLYLEIAAAVTDMDLSGVDPADPETFPEGLSDAISRALDNMSEQESQAFDELYNRLLIEKSRIVTSFTYTDLDSRTDSLYSSVPYRMATEYMAGYQPESDNISTVLQNLYSMAFTACVRLDPTEDELDTYGLFEPAYRISFIYHDTDGNSWYNEFVISAKTEDGTYYAYSEFYNMIVSFDESAAPYLEWDDIEWYDHSYYSYNIAHLKEIEISTYGEHITTLTTDNRASDHSGTWTYYLTNPSGSIDASKAELFATALTNTVNQELKTEIITQATVEPLTEGDWSVLKLKLSVVNRHAAARKAVETVITAALSKSDMILSEVVLREGTINSSEMLVYADGRPMDYDITLTSVTGKPQEKKAIDNFRRLIQSLLTANIEGNCTVSEAEMAAIRAGGENTCQLKIKAYLDDDEGETLAIIYRFYQLTERQSYLTIEVLDGPDSPEHPENAQGRFYVLRSFCDKLIADTRRFISAEEIDPDSKN